MEIITKTVQVYKTKDGREFTDRYSAERHERRVDQVHALYEAIKESYRALCNVRSKYSQSGVDDTEGDYCVKNWICKTALGEKVSPITFSSLEGFSEYSPMLGATKAQIGREIAAAANKVVKNLNSAAKKLHIELDVGLVYGIF